MATNIKVKIEFDRNAQKHFISCSKNGNKLYFRVSIPSPLIGVDEELAVSDEWQAKLVKRTSKANQPFLFKICSLSNNKKVFIINIFFSFILFIHFTIEMFKGYHKHNYQIDADGTDQLHNSPNFLTTNRLT